MSGNDRLSGWKEIAAPLDRSVRTVQRWERDLGLPVHRIKTPADGEIVFAYREELDSWLSEQSAPVAPASPRARRWLAAAVVLGSLALTVLTVVAAWPRPGVPASWRLEPNSLHILDASGRDLWQYRFPFSLIVDGNDEAVYRERRTIAIDDLDGDGVKEVVFVAKSYDRQEGSLYAFDDRGRERFRHIVSGRVRFGSEESNAPFQPQGFIIADDGRGTNYVWLLAVHHYNGAGLVEKIDPRNGTVRGRYWANGHVSALAAGSLFGRRVIFVGGTHQESQGASLTVLDFDNPSGCSPAGDPARRCAVEDTTEPIRFWVFPQPEYWKVTDTRAYVSQLLPVHGGMNAVVTALFTGYGPVPWGPVLGHVVDASGRIAKQELGDGYGKFHYVLQDRGLLDHPYDELSCVRQPGYLEWDGTRLVQRAFP